ncbi:MAG: NADH-quinone oxidoreductase subunit NuoG [Dokdonella sp.]
MNAQAVSPDLPPDHVSIEIDGQTLVVPKSSMIIQAADKAGIKIPRFCYHDKLPIAANCRMCMVEVEMGGRPMPKPQPACATPVADGMKIQTQSARALSAQRNVMEFLLINHPLDCPICDQGGECELQDLAVGYGRSVSRFVEGKRVVPDEDLGPLVETDMTRCIHCTRCVRVMSEVAGTYELGGMERGENLQIGTYVGKPLMSEVSGNVIDVCPVGALTNKVFRYRARPWELIARESIAYHDALGSNLWLHTRRGEVLRTVPRDNDAINECWLSDRDRYSHQGMYASDRARRPMLKRDGVWSEVDWPTAITATVEALRRHPANDLGCLVNGATSTEEGFLLAKLVRNLGCGHIDSRLRQLDLADGATASAFEMPMDEIEKASAIVLIGCNPRSELPLLNTRIRKAIKNGAKVHVINPINFDLTYPPTSMHIVAPNGFVDAMLAYARAAADAGHSASHSGLSDALGSAQTSDDATTLVKSLTDESSSVVIVGEMATSHPQASWLRAAARDLAAASGSAYNEIPLTANAIGLAQVGVLPSAGALDSNHQLAHGRQGFVLYGIESPSDFAAGTRSWGTLEKASTVIAFSAFASESLKQVADVILPIGLLPETDASMTNLDGIEQRAAAGVKPPGDARQGWRVLRALGGAMDSDGFDFNDIAELRAGITTCDPQAATVQLAERAHKVDGLVRISSTASYRADAVLRRSPALNDHPIARGACVTLHPEDGAALGLTNGGTKHIEGQKLAVVLSSEVPRGGVWIESGYEQTDALPPCGEAIAMTET